MNALFSVPYSDVVAFSSAPLNRFGAGKAHVRNLGILQRMGIRTFMVNGARSALAQELKTLEVGSLDCPSVLSDAYPESDLIQAYAVGETLAREARAWTQRGYRVLLIGTYLYPFCFSVLHGAALMRETGIRAGVMLMPAGSDIWQIGWRLKDTTRLLLRDPGIDALITYSKRFAEEILGFAGRDIPCQVIPPPVDLRYFYPCRASEKEAWRLRLGIPKDEFNLVHCSNMRPVKELGLTLDLALQLSSSIGRKVGLTLVGPMTEHMRERFCLRGINLAGTEPREFSLKNLQVRIVGMQADPRPYFWSADVALNTSLHDSFNISLAESMACGLPVISTDFPGICELSGIEKASYFFALDRDSLDPLRTGSLQTPFDPLIFMPKLLEWIRPILDNENGESETAKNARPVIESSLSDYSIMPLWSFTLDAVLRKMRPLTSIS